MIIIELKGGLGNQIFQYAAAIALSKHHQVKLKVDITQLKQPDEILGTYRRYILKYLNNPPEIASEGEISKFKNIFKKKIQHFLPINYKNIYYEKFFHYNDNFWKTNKSIFLRGNFQSEKYFLKYKDSIQTSLTFDPSFFSIEDRTLFEKIKTSNNLSMHIRRGDYVTNLIANNVLGILPIDYYNNGYNKIIVQNNIENCYIFSDDINWAKSNFSFIKNVFFVESTSENKDLADFILMQSCKHNIIANSSFSWWAAYLNPNPDKIIIAPKRWFNKANYDTKDLIPSSWIQL
jgi:hypothetical protein